MPVENLMINNDWWSWQEKEFLPIEDAPPSKARLKRERTAFKEAEYGISDEVV